MKSSSALIALCIFGQASAAELAAPAAEPSNIAITDSGVSLPAGAMAREAYVRFYLPMFARGEDELPFTTLPDGFHLKPGLIVVGLFVSPGEFGVSGPPGVRLVTTRAALPYAVHGGCRAVNAVIDAENGATLGSWCNVDEGQPMPHPDGGSSTNERGVAVHGVGLCVRTGNASAGTPILDAEVVAPSGDPGWDEDVRQGMIGSGAPSDTREWSPVWVTDPKAPAPKPDFNCDHHAGLADPHANGR